MQEEFLHYYNKELASIRHLAQEFARTHPKIAGNLAFTAGNNEDPHVGRIVESLAFLTAQIQYKLDDDLPELSQTLLEILYPHYQAPLPSFSIIEMQCQPDLTGGHVLKKDTLLETKPVYGAKCRFKTVYPTTLWPCFIKKVALSGLPINAPAIPTEEITLGLMHLSLQCYVEKMTFAKLKPSSLRFYLDIPAPQVHLLYELIMNNTLKIAIAKSAQDTKPIVLDKTSLHTVGFAKEDKMLPYSAHSSLGYRLLTEYFAFPEKFLFFELSDLEDKWEGIENTCEIFFYLNKECNSIQKDIPKNGLKLGCTPIINLFEQTAEPIALNHTKSEYRVVPDAHRPTMEVYSVTKVTALTENGREIHYSPFYGLTHNGKFKNERRFWQAKRRNKFTEEESRESMTDVYLSFMDAQFDANQIQQWVVQVETLCTDGDLPATLPFGDKEAYFQVDTVAPLSKINCLLPLSKSYRPAIKNELRWKLISHLSLNYLSLTRPDSIDVIKEIIHLYDYTKSAETARIIDGLTKLTTKHITSRNPLPSHAATLCQGIEINLTVDEKVFSSSGLYLFATILEMFFTEYASINSFTKLIITSKQNNGILFQWQPRIGNKFLL